MVSFGMPTLIETGSLEDCAAWCRRLGLSFVELNMNLPQYQPGVMDPEKLAAIGEAYGISYTIHLDENLNVSDFNPYVAEAYCRTVLETIDLARAIHIPVLNMHLSAGVYFTLPEEKVYLFDRYRETYLRSITAFREACTAAIGSSGIQICIENCGGYTPLQVEALDLLLCSPVFGLTFDVGHDHCAGHRDRDVLQQRMQKLGHMHLHDAVRDPRKDHLALGTGEVDLRNCLQLARQQQCRVVLETKTLAGLQTSVQWLAAHREVFDNI